MARTTDAAPVEAAADDASQAIPDPAEQVATEAESQATPQIAPLADPGPGPSLVVKGPARGRWRAGRHFSAEPTSIALSDLDERELALLQGDPELSLAIVNPPY